MSGRPWKLGAGIRVTNEWLPAYKNYQDGDVVDTQNDSTFITSLFVVMVGESCKLELGSTHELARVAWLFAFCF